VKALVFGAAVLAACTNDPPPVDLPKGEIFAVDVCMDTNGTWPYLVTTRESILWLSSCDASIRKASTLDGTVQVLVSNEPRASMLAADDENVYWTRVDSSSLNGELMKASQLDGVPVVLASGQEEMFDDVPQQLVVDEANVYRSEFFDILSVPKDGSAPQQVAARGTSNPFLAVDAEYLYWASHASVHRQRKGTNVDEELALSSTIWEPIALTDQAVFFWSSADGRLYRIDKSTDGPAMAVLDGWPLNRAFISDGVANLYWQSGSALVRLSEDGTVTPIVEIEGGADALAVDDEFIYWIRTTTIYRARR
jgi:hypothetical protein